jgi:hypothetical protein
MTVAELSERFAQLERPGRSLKKFKNKIRHVRAMNEDIADIEYGDLDIGESWRVRFADDDNYSGDSLTNEVKKRRYLVSDTDKRRKTWL